MEALKIILMELGYTIRKHNQGYELTHINKEVKHPHLVGKVLLPFYEQDLECVAFFIARKIKELKE